MADPVTTTALMVAIYFCTAGYATDNSKCADGTERHKQVVSLLVAKGAVNNIVEIDIDDQRVYTMQANGAVAKSQDFHDDVAARNFWASLSRELPNVCEVAKDWYSREHK